MSLAYVETTDTYLGAGGQQQQMIFYNYIIVSYLYSICYLLMIVFIGILYTNVQTILNNNNWKLYHTAWPTVRHFETKEKNGGPA